MATPQEMMGAMMLTPPTDGALEVSDDAVIQVVDRPLSERLRYGTDLHRKVLERLKERKEFSKGYIEERYDDWDRTREHLKLFIDLTRNARKGDKTSDNTVKEMPFERSIVVPLSYATHQILLAQMMSIFGSRTPLFPLVGTEGSDIYKAIQMETMLDYDCRMTKAFSRMYSNFHDAFAFGMGVTYDSWEVKQGVIQRRVPIIQGVPIELLEMVLGDGAYTTIDEYKVVKEYNKLTPIDPYAFWPDPRVPLSNLQDGEFCGHDFIETYVNMLKRSGDSGPYFNIEELPKRKSTTYKDITKSSVGINDNLPELTIAGEEKGAYNCTYMCVELIPEDWELSGAETPEKWVFTWAEDEVIVRAHKMPNGHQEFPYSVSETNPGFHDTFSPGSIEMIDGLQRYMTWLFNCHDANTEVLTQRGWVPFPCLSESDMVVKVDRETFSACLEKPEKIHVHDYDGRMIVANTQGSNWCVTPNHRLLVSDSWESNFSMKEAWDVIGKTSFELTEIDWSNGAAPIDLCLDGIPPKRFRGNEQRHDTVTIGHVELEEFVGWFVSEGSVSKPFNKRGAYSVSIRQKNEDSVRKIDNLMSRMPLHVTRHVDRNGGVSWSISDKRFWRWVVDECHTDATDTSSYTKRIPPAMKQLPSDSLRRIFDAAMDGDGHWSGDIGTYGSTSKQLADDIQELAIKLGYRSSVVNDSHLSKSSEFWRVNITKNSSPRRIPASGITSIPYRGSVYCVDVGGHCFVTRRNGKVSYHGNSHYEDVVRNVNNKYVYSPRIVEQVDMEYGGPGQNIRLTNEAVEMLLNGEIASVQNLLFQLPTQDVTGPTYMNAIQYVHQMAQLMSGVNDPLSGMPTPTERSATEINTITAKASDRIAILARLVDDMSIEPMVQRMIANRQQFTQLEKYYRITGEMASRLGEQGLFASVHDIQGKFDYVVTSGIVPPDPARQGTLYSNMLAAAGQIPQLQQPGPDGRMLDFRKIFDVMIEKSGIRNVSDFYVQVVPDEQLQQQVQAGNVVPMQGAGGM